MGSYNMDSHHVQRYVAKDENGKSYVLNEGDIQINPGAPYQISYDSLVPQKVSVKIYWYPFVYPHRTLLLVQYGWSLCL